MTQERECDCIGTCAQCGKEYGGGACGVCGVETTKVGIDHTKAFELKGEL